MTIFYHGIRTNIHKVECRGKIYFHYAETKRIYERQLKYSKSRAQTSNLFEYLPKGLIKSRAETGPEARNTFERGRKLIFLGGEFFKEKQWRVAKIYFYGHPPIPDTKNQYASSRTDSGMDVRT